MRIPACTTMTNVVTAIKILRRLSSIGAPIVAPTARCSDRAPLDILRRFGSGGGRLRIRLTASFISGAEALFLLVEHIVAAVHPLARLFARAASLLARLIAAFLRFGANHIAHLIARARS